MLGNAAAKQQTIASDASRAVDNYLGTITGQLNIIAGVYALKPVEIDQNLQALLKEDPNLQKVEILTKDDKKRVATLRGGQLRVAITDIESDDTTFDRIANKKRILSLSRDLNNTPELAISLPIRSSADDTDNSLIGVVVGYYEMGTVWKSVLPEQTDTDGYTYIVDGTGSLVYHPDYNFLSTHTDIHSTAAVSDFLSLSLKTKQTVSETNENVLSAVRETEAGWGVVAEEPISSAYAGVNSFTKLAVTVTIGAVAASVVVGLFFSRQLIRPIKRLVVGARKLAQNNLTQKIDIRTKDEFEELASIFNNLGVTVGNLVSNLEANNRSLTFEQSNLQSIINSVNDGVVAVNIKGEILSINAPAIRLVSNAPYMVKGKSIEEVFPWTREGAPFKLDLTSTGFHSYNDVVLAKNESVAYLDLMVEVIDRESGDVAAIITIHDQTPSRELNFMKLDFVAVAAHELRTPLTVISGYLDILNREALKELSLENLESLQKAIVGAQQLRELINKLLNIARIERGDMEIFLEKLNLTQLVAKSVEQHQPVAAQKGQALSFTSNTTSTVYAPADTSSIVEVLNNLIGNAIKYTPENGQIQVNIIASGEQVRVEITDNGPGVPEELRDKLFSKFYRAERSLIAGTRGTGLGLFISKTIIELQRGTIGIKPDQGNGSTFYFTLPIYKPEKDDEIVAKNISRGKHGWYKKRSAH